jgi:hypothetical protein
MVRMGWLRREENRQEENTGKLADASSFASYQWEKSGQPRCRKEEEEKGGMSW